ncbi:MAG: Lrp/AsnC ligand binding domain-containing protein [Acidimicrobiia bacterium]|nr:Lrp/AsnC ligand binding domain-containing protein [Acidimicrobiia bacterium]
MSVSAYVLIQTEMDQAADVARSIRGMEGVEATDVITGPYDVIVKATAPDMNSLGHMVIGRMQAVGGITRTLTCPVVEI